MLSRLGQDLKARRYWGFRFPGWLGVLTAIRKGDLGGAILAPRQVAPARRQGAFVLGRIGPFGHDRSPFPMRPGLYECLGLFSTIAPETISNRGFLNQKERFGNPSKLKVAQGEQNCITQEFSAGGRGRAHPLQGQADRHPHQQIRQLLRIHRNGSAES